ncbi:MAG: DoxX family protein [Deltaproteobacteria bacterium]|nr:DoxX family protein [Deltaproteobacteria bacterium]
MNKTLESLATLTGRLFLSAIFMMAGFGKIMDLSGTSAYMASQGMPLVPFFLAMAIIFELGGGLSLLIGFKTRWGALALIAFLIPTTLIFHNFWADPPDQRQLQMIMFLKNLAILGGLLTVLAHGPGSMSIDSRTSKKTKT